MKSAFLLLAALALVACGGDEDGSSNARIDDDTGADAGADVGVDLGEPDFGPPPEEAELFESLPVEVFGSPGSAAVEIELPDAIVGAPTSELHLRIHNLVAHDSAAVWINGEHRYELSGDDSPFVRPTGGWADGVVELEPAHLSEGTNHFVFEYTGQIPQVTGYRVLAVRIDAGGESAFGPTAFEDPTGWTPITEDADDVESGRTHFQENARDDGPACGTCHTFTGADLAYYAYSNRAIVAQAMARGFTRTEGEQIASYVRTRGIEPEGRPWIAPFQPGPHNFAAAGSGLDAIVEDAEVLAAYTDGAMPDQISWDHAAEFDTFEIPSSVQAPTWSRWLPRDIDRQWFEQRDGELQGAFRDLEVDGSLESAHAFSAAAVSVGEELSASGDHAGRIELARFAAVQLWDWSRRQSFYQDDHGFPNDAYGTDGLWGSPPYPSEVGSAFFDASAADEPYATEQALGWWIAQIAADPGRGRSDGHRPLNYRDVLVAAAPSVGPAESTWIYLLGSWEESRGPLENSWGDPIGPVRLLEVALPQARPEWLPALWRRHMDREVAYSRSGGRFSDDHAALLQSAWAETCGDLDDDARQQIIAGTPDELRDALICPP